MMPSPLTGEGQGEGDQPPRLTSTPGHLLDEVQDGRVVGVVLAVVHQRAEHLLNQRRYGQRHV